MGYPQMKEEPVLSEVRLLLKQIPVVKTLLLILIIVVVLGIGTFYFSRTNGRAWYEALFIFAWLTWLSVRHWFQQPTTSQNTAPEPRVQPERSANSGMIRRVLPNLVTMVRDTFYFVVSGSIMIGSIWLLVTLVRWFWLHPLSGKR